MIRATLALSALLLGPWLFRAIALFESPRAVQWNDLRGFTAEVPLRRRLAERFNARCLVAWDEFHEAVSRAKTAIACARDHA